MKLPGLTLLLLAGGCATAPVPTADRDWIVGTWCPDGRTTHAGMEVMLRPTRFNADGTYSTFEHRGRWALAGDRLERTSGTTNVRASGRIERLGSGRMARTDDGGEREIWNRCEAPA